MDLETYLSSRNIERYEFAGWLGISVRSFLHYRKGTRDWPLSLALKVEDLTDEKVTVYDLAKPHSKK